MLREDNTMGVPGTVRLEPWGVGDLPVLERSNTPAMMGYLGGPESTEDRKSVV